jgi:hypothetical protein
MIKRVNSVFIFRLQSVYHKDASLESMTWIEPVSAPFRGVKDIRIFSRERTMPDSLEDEFHREMIDIYQNLLRDCTGKAAYFLEMVGRQGGIETAKKLLQSDDIERGSTTLWKCGRLDLMFEYLVLQPKYAELFTDAEKEMARNRLKERGHSF